MLQPAIRRDQPYLLLCGKKISWWIPCSSGINGHFFWFFLILLFAFCLRVILLRDKASYAIWRHLASDGYEQFIGIYYTETLLNETALYTSDQVYGLLAGNLLKLVSHIP